MVIVDSFNSSLQFLIVTLAPTVEGFLEGICEELRALYHAVDDHKIVVAKADAVYLDLACRFLLLALDFIDYSQLNVLTESHFLGFEDGLSSLLVPVEFLISLFSSLKGLKHIEVLNADVHLDAEVRQAHVALAASDSIFIVLLFELIDESRVDDRESGRNNN